MERLGDFGKKKDIYIFMSHKYLTRPPIYLKYDYFSVYIERGDLKQYRLPLRCLMGLYPELYVEQKNSHLDNWSCNLLWQTDVHQ